MTYHLAALRLRSIGERSARFTDLTLDLTAPEGDVLAPSDSLVWLRNGGGKSSLLSLFYALLLPHANDFMGRSVKRSLTDYVDTGDTAHTVAVWHPVDRRTLDGEPDRVLVTGAIYEWQDLRRPPDPDKDRDRLNASYYAFFAVPGVIGPGSLPLTDADGRPMRRSAVISRLRDLAEDHAAAMDLSLPRTQRDWTEELQRRGIDPELYRRQKEMNHVEGGVEDLFRFASAREFVDFLLDLTVPPEEASTVAERLAQIADLLATKPAKTDERDFCREAAIGLTRIDSARTDVLGEAGRLTSAVAAAATLAAAFTATVEAAGNARQNLELQRTVITQALDRARAERDEAADTAHLYRHRAAQLRVAAARAESDRAARTAADAVLELEATRLVQPLAERVHLGAALEQVRHDARVERADTAPLRAARDLRAAALLTRWGALARELSETAERAATEAALHRAAAEGHGKAAGLAAEEVSEAHRAIAVAETHLEELRTRLAAAADSGLLTTGADPATELAAHGAHRAERQRELEDVRSARSARPAERSVLVRRGQDLGSERTRADAERSASANELAGLRERAAGLAAVPRIRDLAEATAAAPVDLWAEAGVLVRRLVEAVRGADEDLIRFEASRLDDERSLDGQTRTGLLPTSLDAARVLAALEEHDVPAESGWAHLREVRPADRLADSLTDPALARLGCGIVVPTDQADRAAGVLTSLGTVTTALVEVYPAAAADALIRASASGSVPGAPAAPAAVEPAWARLQPGLLEVTAAEGAAVEIRARLARQDVARGETVERRDADRGLIARIEALWRDSPEGYLEVLTNRISSLDAALEQSDTSLARVAQDLEALDRADVEDAARERSLAEELATLGESLIRLGALAERVAEAPQWRERLEQSRRWLDTAQRQAQEASGKVQQAIGAADRAEAEARSATADAARHRADAAGIEFLDGPPAPPTPSEALPSEALPLDVLRDLFRDADTTYRQQVSGSVLAEREKNLTDRLTAAASEIARAEAPVRERAETLIGSAAGQTEAAREQALREAERVRSEADRAVGAATGAIASAESALQGLVSRRALPTRALPQSPADPEEADRLADAQEGAVEHGRDGMRRAEQQLQGLQLEDGRLRERGNAFGYLRQDLPDPAAGPAEPFAGDETEAKQTRRAVTGELAAAQSRHRDAETILTRAISAVRAVAARFPGVGTPARDRVTGDPEEVLAATAAALAEGLLLRAGMIDGELEDIAKDQAIVTSSLAHLVGDTLDTLRKAERYSRLPESLGSWAGKRMMRIGFDSPAGEGDLRSCVDRVIERRVAEGVKPQGLPLLKEAVHEAVGPRGFSVKVLKPTPDVAATSEDITRLGKWSGGEKLTVCVAIYCTLAALRARNTGRGETSGGVLVLDNPIGRASHGSLVRLQRDVAAAHGVQLIYTTGVKDPDAVSRFPNVLRLDNRPGRTRNRRYIVQDPAPDAVDADPVRFVTGTRVAHDENLADDTGPGDEQG